MTTRVPKDPEALRVVRWLCVRVEAVRRERGWSQKQLARAAGVSEAVISFIVNQSDLDRFTIDRLLTILRKLGCAVTIEVGE